MLIPSILPRSVKCLFSSVKCHFIRIKCLFSVVCGHFSVANRLFISVSEVLAVSILRIFSCEGTKFSASLQAFSPCDMTYDDL